MRKLRAREALRRMDESLTSYNKIHGEFISYTPFPGAILILDSQCDPPTEIGKLEFKTAYEAMHRSLKERRKFWESVLNSRAVPPGAARD